MATMLDTARRCNGIGAVSLGKRLPVASPEQLYTLSRIASEANRLSEATTVQAYQLRLKTLKAYVRSL